MKKHIFLNGFMGAGKSKIGPILAVKFACPFYDTDKLVEMETGKNISDIFRDEGEEQFRQLESRMIRQLAYQKTKSVIALGGGALTFNDNNSIARDSGIIVYVKSSPRAIFERVKNSKKRPLLNVARDENFDQNLIKMITDLLERRKKIYESADIIFNRDSYDYEQAADLIYRDILKYERD